MKWLLRFIPHLTIINFLCDLIKEKWTSKTKTTIDDIAVEKILRPSLIMWWECAIDPNITADDTALKTALLGIRFLDEKGLGELESHISTRRNELSNSPK
jgi:hypothetical protein